MIGEANSVRPIGLDLSRIRYSCIGVARGCSGCTCTPRAVKKILVRPNLQEKCVSAPPQDTKCTYQQEQESIFRSFCWVVKKCTPADKILATPMYSWLNVGHSTRVYACYLYTYIRHSCIYALERFIFNIFCVNRRIYFIRLFYKKLITRLDSERELFYDKIEHTLQNNNIYGSIAEVCYHAKIHC